MFNAATGRDEALVIPRGIRIQGRVTLFKDTFLEWHADLKVVVALTEFLIDYKQDPIDWGPFTVTSVHDENKGPVICAMCGGRL